MTDGVPRLEVRISGCGRKSSQVDLGSGGVVLQVRCRVVANGCSSEPCVLPSEAFQILPLVSLGSYTWSLSSELAAGDPPSEAVRVTESLREAISAVGEEGRDVSQDLPSEAVRVMESLKEAVLTAGEGGGGVPSSFSAGEMTGEASSPPVGEAGV